MNPVVNVEALFEEGFVGTFVALVTFTRFPLVDPPVTSQTSHVNKPLPANLTGEVPVKKNTGQLAQLQRNLFEHD